MLCGDAAPRALAGPLHGAGPGGSPPRRAAPELAKTMKCPTSNGEGLTSPRSACKVGGMRSMWRGAWEPDVLAEAPLAPSWAAGPLVPSSKPWAAPLATQEQGSGLFLAALDRSRWVPS